ncbi:hypothetical protein F2P79_004573 [Pimephales promelas]|nr:hypothetical protein F2P79_004573 [Pimephales promelas]
MRGKMNVELLFSLVLEHKELYDKRNSDYKHLDKRELYGVCSPGERELLTVTHSRRNRALRFLCGPVKEAVRRKVDCVNHYSKHLIWRRRRRKLWIWKTLLHKYAASCLTSPAPRSHAVLNTVDHPGSRAVVFGVGSSGVRLAGVLQGGMGLP